MKKRVKIFCLILIAFISACDKEDSIVIQSDNTGLIYQVKFDSELFYEYTYNNLNQVVEEKSKWHYTRHNYQYGQLISSDYYIDPGIYSSCSYRADSSFNRKEWVNPSNTEKNSTKTYSYDDKGNLLKSSDHLNITEYNYDDKNRIIRQTFYHDNKQTGYIDFTYDGNDNLIKRLHYWILASGESELQTTTVYEFDSNLNPYKAFSSLLIPGRNTNTNNITKETYTIHFDVDQFTNNVQITENYYQYNSQRFPVTKNDSETYIYY